MSGAISRSHPSDQAAARLGGSRFDPGHGGVKTARISSAEVEHAKAVAEKAGLRLTALQKSPDGTIKFEFGNDEATNDWRAGSPLYSIK